MWWFYKKLYEDEHLARYAYACESYDADGELLYSKPDETVEITKPSHTTKSERAQERAMENMYDVVGRGFPENTQVACG